MEVDFTRYLLSELTKLNPEMIYLLIKNKNTHTIFQMVSSCGLYYDLIGLICEYLHGDKSYWKTKFKSTLDIIRTQEVKKYAICFDTLKIRFSDFLLLQGEYDLYVSPQNEVVKSIHDTGKCSVHEFILSHAIIEKLFYTKYIANMQKYLIQHKWLSKCATKKLTQPLHAFSVYKFGNHYHTHSIMNNRWVGSVMQQDNMILVLNELKHMYEMREKDLLVKKRKANFFQLHAVFTIHKFVYHVVGIYKKKLKLQDQYGEYRYCSYMQDNENCFYVFPDKRCKYKYYTDNSIEKIW